MLSMMPLSLRSSASSWVPHWNQKLLEAVLGLLQARVHRPHEDAIFEGSETEIEGRKEAGKVGIGHR